MNTIQGLFPVVKVDLIADWLFELYVRCPAIAQSAKPGQFVLIRPQGFPLRRPIAVCETDSGNGIVRFVIGIRGDGTKKLADLSEKDWVDVMGPLGNGFSLNRDQKCVFIGGGLGVPPLLEAAKQSGSNARAILGFQTGNQVALVEEFCHNGISTVLMTDDGSKGRKGLVTDALNEYLKDEKPEAIYACGPVAMLKEIAAIASRGNIRCQVLMEERMGCGVGACQVCVCKTKGPAGGAVHSRVCTDGPVFDAEKVVF